MRFPKWMNLDWLLPFKPEETSRPTVSFTATHDFPFSEHRSRRLWLIDNRQESLRSEIAAAKKAKRKHSHLLAEMQRLTTERMRLERG